VDSGKLYFIEVNPRIQVEHTVTEMVTGIDLVKTQIEVAAGLTLPFAQSDLHQHGWALECRIYAEDAAAGFTPAPGRIVAMTLPDGPGVRVDAGVYAGAEVSVFYDPMIAKLATWGRDRAEAIARMRRALGEFKIAGELATNLEFHQWITGHPRFVAGDFDTNFIAQEYRPASAAPNGDPVRLSAILAAAFAAQRDGNHTSAGAPAPSRTLAAPSPWKMVGRSRILH
ncbi:MAG: acetyl-CoA carboxylase biotin carboxylase subunit, partial [Candidatus Binataceae bacterium]